MSVLNEQQIERMAKSLADMVKEWGEGGERMRTDWKNGLEAVIRARLSRLAKEFDKPSEIDLQELVESLDGLDIPSPLDEDIATLVGAVKSNFDRAAHWEKTTSSELLTELMQMGDRYQSVQQVSVNVGLLRQLLREVREWRHAARWHTPTKEGD